MSERFEVYVDPRLKPLCEKLAEDPEIIKQLIQHGLSEDAKGVAKLAVYKFLEGKGIFPSSFRSVNNKERESPRLR